MVGVKHSEKYKSELSVTGTSIFHSSIFFSPLIILFVILLFIILIFSPLPPQASPSFSILLTHHIITEAAPLTCVQGTFASEKLPTKQVYIDMVIVSATPVPALLNSYFYDYDKLLTAGEWCVTKKRKKG